MARPPGKRKGGKSRAAKPSADKTRRKQSSRGKQVGFAARPKPPQRRPQFAAAGQGSSGEPRLGERLQKALAAAGLASRRECEELIVEGRVQVDGEVVTELGTRVDRSRQEIKVDGEPLPRTRLQYFAVHKPSGVVSTARDPSGRPRVIDLLPSGVGRMFNVGRLDMASEGLIIVTNDGPLANQLTHPRHGVEKIYEVQVAGQPAPDVLAQIKQGVHLSDGFVHAVDVRIKGAKKGSTLLEMTLDEGRNREIRRLLARLGHKVQRLTRIAVGPIRLGELPRGAVRPLTHDEIDRLRRASAEGKRPAADDSMPSSKPAHISAGGPQRVVLHGARAGHGSAKLTGRKAPAKQRGGRMAGAEPSRRIIGAEATLPEAASQPPRKLGKKKTAHGGTRNRQAGGRPGPKGKRQRGGRK